MKVKHLIEALKELPEDAPVEIGKFLAINEESDDAYEVRLDFPMAGFGLDPQTGDVVFLVGTSDKTLPWLHKFGEVEKMTQAEIAEG